MPYGLSSSRTPDNIRHGAVLHAGRYERLRESAERIRGGFETQLNTCGHQWSTDWPLGKIDNFLCAIFQSVLGSRRAWMPLWRYRSGRNLDAEVYTVAGGPLRLGSHGVRCVRQYYYRRFAVVDIDPPRGPEDIDMASLVQSCLESAGTEDGVPLCESEFGQCINDRSCSRPQLEGLYCLFTSMTGVLLGGLTGSDRVIAYFSSCFNILWPRVQNLLETGVDDPSLAK